MLIRESLPSVHGHAYLNTGTCGPLPLAAAEAMSRQVALGVDSPRIGADAFQRLMALRERGRAAAARAVSAPADQVALTSSTTQGIGLVIGGLEWRAGDEVITTDEEHQGLRAPLDVLSRRAGVVVRELPADELLTAISQRTTLVAVSHVLWTTGRVLDLAAIAERCRARDALLLVDGAQSVGAIAVDVAATGADFYAFSGQKWLLGPEGSGGLWVDPAQHDVLWPALSGYLSVEGGKVGQWRPGAARFDGGSIDSVTLAGFAAALEWVESLPGGRAAWLDRTASNAAAARARLAEVPGIHLAPARPGSPLIAIAVGDRPSAEPLVAPLAERGVLVRFIPDTRWLRISVGAWTTVEEIEMLCEGVEGLG